MTTTRTGSRNQRNNPYLFDGLFVTSYYEQAIKGQ